MANTDEKMEIKDKLLKGPLNSDNVRKIFSGSDDVVSRDCYINNASILKVTIVYIDGMANMKVINDNIVFALSTSDWYKNCKTPANAYNLSLHGALDVSSIRPAKNIKDAVDAVLVGKTILVFDNIKSALIADTIGFEKRSIAPATEENTYRSGKDSFVETLRSNTATLRKKIRSPHLCLKETTVGKQSNTRVCIAYMDNICNDAFVEKIKNRVESINQDKAMSIRDIYSNVVKEKYTPFPTAVVSEKADVCCMSLLDGKVALIVDELPYAMLFPAVFGDLFHSPFDYGSNFIVATFFRIIRYLCFIIAITLPGFYVAVTAFHPEMIPYDLDISIAASRTGVPFSVFIEVLIMTLAFYVLIQASLQISQAIGATISIVGGLVLGEAAITAGLISPAVIVVVATASICSMGIPNKDANTAIWLFQLICTLTSAALGLVGLIIGLLLLLFALAKLEPLGIPYLSPYATRAPLQLEDSIIRFPDNLIKKRPEYLKPKNIRRKR